MASWDVTAKTWILGFGYRAFCLFDYVGTHHKQYWLGSNTHWKYACRNGENQTEYVIPFYGNYTCSCKESDVIHV